MVAGEGFEPSKAKPSDLQSDPFDHSGTPPAETLGVTRSFPFVPVVTGDQTNLLSERKAIRSPFSDPNR
jgi:hypothetical protein